jgi:hypothetical protein
MAALPIPEIPSATVLSLNTSVAYDQAKGAIQDVVISTLYILSNTNIVYGGRHTVRRPKKALLERVEPKGSRGSVKHSCVYCWHSMLDMGFRVPRIQR